MHQPRGSRVSEPRLDAQNADAPEVIEKREVAIRYFQKQFICGDQVAFISGMQSWLNIQIPVNVIHHINKKRKKEKNTITSADSEK